MRFPGQRKSTHYFPVDKRDPLLCQSAEAACLEPTHVVGIDQTLVDIESVVSDSLLERYDLSKGHSLVISDAQAEQLYEELRGADLIAQQFAGGTVGNTLHNYSTLADDNSILLGVMSREIRIGSYAYRYLCNTSSRVNLEHLQPVDGPVGRCFALITSDGERTFAINEGHMNQLTPDSIPRSVFDGASALVLTAYLMRGADGDPLPAATRRAIGYARQAQVPVVLTLGTKFVIAEDPGFWQKFIDDHVDVVAMNEFEAAALTGEMDPLLACRRSLDWCDLALCTAGSLGLFMAGYSDDEVKRMTRHPLLPGAIPEFNRFEFSRPMRKDRCDRPIQVFSFIAPYMGGPERIRNTNGAGDGALAALLHDMAANRYHRANVPTSAKHTHQYLTYSSFAQLCKYANRVAYEVLAQQAPRLSRGLPGHEDSLEEVYWAR
jgi:inosine kinase